MLAAILRILIQFNAVQFTSCFPNSMFAIGDVPDAVRAGQILFTNSPGVAEVDVNPLPDWLARRCG